MNDIGELDVLHLTRTIRESSMHKILNNKHIRNNKDDLRHFRYTNNQSYDKGKITLNNTVAKHLQNKFVRLGAIHERHENLSDSSSEEELSGNFYFYLSARLIIQMLLSFRHQK